MCQRSKALQIADPSMTHFGLSFYAKVSAACFALGGGMEMFMLRTGFYDK